MGEQRADLLTDSPVDLSPVIVQRSNDPFLVSAQSVASGNRPKTLLLPGFPKTLLTQSVRNLIWNFYTPAIYKFNIGQKENDGSRRLFSFHLMPAEISL